MSDEVSDEVVSLVWSLLQTNAAAVLGADVHQLGQCGQSGQLNYAARTRMSHINLHSPSLTTGQSLATGQFENLIHSVLTFDLCE